MGSGEWTPLSFRGDGFDFDGDNMYQKGKDTFESLGALHTVWLMGVEVWKAGDHATITTAFKDHDPRGPR